MIDMKPKHSNWYYEPVCDWYIRHITYYKNGAAYAYREFAPYYYGKTNIPLVKRKKK